MHVEGTVDIRAPRQQVWAFLTDPHAVSQCAPGMESLEVIEPGRRFRAIASVGLGSIRARFTTDVEWTSLDPPDRAEMRARGQAPGSAVEATSDMRLEEVEGGNTRLHWGADVAVMGTIASLASRLMGSVADKLAAEFFDCVKSRIET
jgi:uncharacterized protein